MRERIDQEVSVVMYYSANKKLARPYLINWQNREFSVKEIGYKHGVMKGHILHHKFEFSVKEEDLYMRLSLDTSNLHWLLETISDGNPD